MQFIVHIFWDVIFINFSYNCVEFIWRAHFTVYIEISKYINNITLAFYYLTYDTILWHLVDFIKEYRRNKLMEEFKEFQTLWSSITGDKLKILFILILIWCDILCHLFWVSSRLHLYVFWILFSPKIFVVHSCILLSSTS
jgi:hypothetical protein